MIKELNDLASWLVQSLSTKPLATFVAIFLVFSGYMVYKGYDSIIISPDEEAVRFEKQIKSANIIDDALENLRSELKADNVLIRQFHNGRHDLTGIPFTEASTTYFVDPVDGHDPIKEEPIGSMHKSIGQMWARIDRPSCVMLYNPVDISTRRYFKAHNLKSAAFCPLTNLLNYPIGVVVVGFSEGDTDDEVVLAKTSALAKRVTGYLQDAS